MDENNIELPAEPVIKQPAVEEVIETPEAPQEEEAQVVKQEQPVEDTNKGASQRIKELNQRAKVAEEKAQSLSDRLAEISQAPTYQQQQYIPQVQPGQEITPEQYQSDVTKVARAEVDLQIKQNNAINRINIESADAIRKYPQLDPESDKFDRELSESVVEATEAFVRAQPYTASVKSFVDKVMKPYQRAISKEVGKQSEQIAKQVSQSALRPTSVRQPEKPATEKSIAELEAELGTVVA